MANYRIPVLETFSWQPPVKGIQNPPPGSPVKGDRYIVGDTPTLAWVGHAWSVATYDGAAWLFDVPAEGWIAYSEATDDLKVYDGAAWANLPAPAHAAAHKSGGADAIKLDELAAPTDVTTLNADTSKHGLLPKLGGGTSNFLRADGTWAAPAGGAVPTGTGFRHVTAGAEDAASKLVENADVAAGAAIVESKLALNNPTHSAANDPSAGEKAALAGTSGTPGAGNKYVTNQDGRLPTYDSGYKCLTFTI